MIHSENTGVGYYRIWSPAKWLTKLGLVDVKRVPDDYETLPLDKSSRDPIHGSMEEMIEWADLLVFQRRETYAQYSLIDTILNVYHKPVVFEIDDNLMSIDKSHPQYEVHRDKPFNDAFSIIRIKKCELSHYTKIMPVVKIGVHQPNDGYVDIMVTKGWDCGWLNRNMIPKFTAVTTTTEYLANAYRKLNKNVHVLPNCIDFELWDNLPPKVDNDKVVIGWAGGAQHGKDITSIVNVIDTILKKYQNVEFRIVRCLPEKMDNLMRKYPDRIKFLGKGVRIQEYPATYKGWGFDIGIAPLWISEFNKCKSNLKWLENSAIKIPTVASDIECYRDIIHGETGYLCKQEEDWVNSLSELIESKEKREQVGQNAYDIVKVKYNAESNAYLYAKTYENILNQK